jgi:hypothetical protein
MCWIGCGEQGPWPARDCDAGPQGGGGYPEGAASSGRALTSDSAYLPGMLQATHGAERTPVLRMWLAGVQREVCARTCTSRGM